MSQSLFGLDRERLNPSRLETEPAIVFDESEEYGLSFSPVAASDPKDDSGTPPEPEDDEEEENDEPILLSEYEVLETIQEVFGLNETKAREIHKALQQFASLSLELIEVRTNDLFNECEAKLEQAQAHIDSYEVKLAEAGEQMAVVEQMADSITCQTIFNESTRDMSYLQQEKLRVLCQNLPLTDDYPEQINIIRNQHFPKRTTNKPVSYQTLAEDTDLDDTRQPANKEMASIMAATTRLSKGNYTP